MTATEIVERLTRCAPHAYIVCAVITFGAAFHSTQESGLCREDTKLKAVACAAIVGAPVAATLWPLYWSVRLWEIGR